MYQLKKIDEYDYRLAKKGLLFGVPNTILSLAIVYWGIRLGAQVDWLAIPSAALDEIRTFFGHFFQIKQPINKTTV